MTADHKRPYNPPALIGKCLLMCPVAERLR